MKCKKCSAELNEEDYVFMGYCEDCYAKYVDNEVVQYNELNSLNNINEENDNPSIFEVLQDIKQQKKEQKKIKHYGLQEYEEEKDFGKMQYEYLVKSFIDEDSGDTDPQVLEKIINNCAKQGWRLKQIYTNEIGRNSVGVGIGGLGSQTNATIERTFLIFERKLK